MKNDVCNVAVLLMFVSLLSLGAGPVSASTDDPNFIARNPYPAHGEIDVSVEPNLTVTWDIGDANTEGYTIEYDVYYGTDQNEVETSTNPHVIGIEAKSHTLSGLEHDTEYFWRIDTRETYWDPDNFPPIVTFRIIKGNVWRFTTGPAPPRVITVDDDGSADFNNIQAAIDDSNDGDTVLVADGTYTGDGNRDIDFHGKAITVKSQNGPEHCFIDCNGTEAEPHRGFYFHSDEDANSAIIGFTITKGYALSECRPDQSFTCSWPGGGIRCDGASPTISDCIIMGNRAQSGGGIDCEAGDPTVTHCTITGNYAVIHGAGMRIWRSSAIITNCTFSDNSLDDDGGAVYTSWGNPLLTNCTFAGNPGEAIYHYGIGGPTLTNCVLWGNGQEIYVYSPRYGGLVTARYCDIEGGWPGEGNIDTDPCFADPNNGDYHLKSQAGRWNPNEGRWVMDDVTSPCIDAGDPMMPIGLELFPNGGIINMGAYGGTVEASKSYFNKPTCQTKVAGDIDGDCMVNFEDFRLLALHWTEDRNPLAEISDFYYYSAGDEVFLDICTDYFAVCFNEGVSRDEIQALIDRDYILCRIWSDTVDEGLIVFSTRPATTESDIIKATQRFERLSQVKYASPVFGDYITGLVILKDEFIAKFHPDVTQEEIDELNALYDVEVIRYPDWRDWYLLRVRDLTNFKTLTTANIYYESSLTEYAVPNFGLLMSSFP